jgi:EPS-associated MarR family transcriptional regulator
LPHPLPRSPERHGTAVAFQNRNQTQIFQRRLNANASASQPPMPSRQAKLQEDTYFRVMRLLQDNPDLTQRELAEKLGISVGGLNYCLKALMEKGLVKMKNFANSKNKFGYVYVLTPTGIAEKAAITHRFLQRKMDEYDALKAEIEVLRAESAEQNSSARKNL